MKTFFKNRKNPRSEGPVVDLNERLFFYLGKISIFSIISYVLKNKKFKGMHTFVDLWVVGNLVTSILLSFTVVKFFKRESLLLISFSYAALRVFEIIIMEIIFWCATMIASLLKLSSYQVAISYASYIQSSFLCLTTFNYDLVANISNT